jgi:dATP pyrophosphohydrolase
MVYKIPESVLVVIYTKELDVLLIERADKPNFWQSVTGSKDTADELIVETARREVLEETGIRILNADCTMVKAPNEVLFETLQDWHMSNVYEIYPMWGYRYAPDVKHNTEHVFGLQVSRDIPVLLAPREHVNYVWLPYEAAANKCFSSSNAHAIRQLPLRNK